jgi:hypothetical protein
MHPNTSRLSIPIPRRPLFSCLLFGLATTAEDLRQAELEANLRRAHNDPPAMDIRSGRALNDLLRAMRTLTKMRMARRILSPARAKASRRVLRAHVSCSN